MRAALISGLVLASCTGGRRAAPVERSEIRWEAPVELARGGGQRGEWRQNDSDYDYVDDTTVALAPDGAAVVAWVDQARKEIFVQRYSPDGVPTTPVAVSRTPAVYSWLPRLALAGDDVYVLWQEIVFSGGTHGGEIFFARSRDRGATFEAPQNLSRSRNGDGKGRVAGDVWHNGSLDLAVGDDGVIYAAWTEYDGPLWLSRSLDRGATFTAPARIARSGFAGPRSGALALRRSIDDGARPARAPALAAAGATVYLAWSVGEDAAADVRLAVSTDRGETFSTPSIVAHTAGYSDAPKLAVDAAGHVHLAWSESTGGPFDSFTVRYARSTDRGQTFERSRELSARSGAQSAAYPMLAVDDTRVVVCWELASAPHGRSRGLALVYSLDRGDTFTSPSLVAHSVDPAGGFNGSHQGRLMEKLAVRDGRIAVANSALVHGRGSRTWFVRGALPGAPLTSARASASSRRGDR